MFDVVSVEFILAAVKTSCVLLFVPPFSPQLQGALEPLVNDVFLSNGMVGGVVASDLFRSEKYVRLSLRDEFDRKVDIRPSSLVVLDKKMEDRSCLLKPTHFTESLKGALVDLTNANLNVILDKINFHCDTFFELDGRVSAKGLHREWLLNNLFSVSQLPQSITMRQIVIQHANDLKSYFYHGHNTCDIKEGCDFCPTDSIASDSNQMSDSPYSIIPKCPEIDGFISADEFYDSYLSQSRPVIFRNALFNEPWQRPLQNWTNQMFREKYGNISVHIKLVPRNNDFEGVENIFKWSGAKQFIKHMPVSIRYNFQFMHLVLVRPAGVDMKMREFVDLIENGNETAPVSAYLEYASVIEYFKDLPGEFPEFPMAEKMKMSQFNVWLSDGNTLGKLHFDEFDNFLAQISGSKQLVLYEPWYNERMYEGYIVEGILTYSNNTFLRNNLLESTSLTMSPVDITEPDLKNFPKFGDSRPLNCTLNPGDVLYMPSFWWHEVQSYPHAHEKRNLAVNFWYQPFFTKQFPCPSCKFDVNREYRDLL